MSYLSHNKFKISSFERYLPPLVRGKTIVAHEMRHKDVQRERFLTAKPEQEIILWAREQEVFPVRRGCDDSESVFFALGGEFLSRGNFSPHEHLRRHGIALNREENKVNPRYFITANILFRSFEDTNAFSIGNGEEAPLSPESMAARTLMRLAPLKNVVEKPTNERFLAIMDRSREIVNGVIDNTFDRNLTLPDDKKRVFLPIGIEDSFPRDYFGRDIIEKISCDILDKDSLVGWFFLRYAVNLTSAYLLDFFDVSRENSPVSRLLNETATRLWPDNLDIQGKYIARVLSNIESYTSD